ncbi:hypothetical protein HDV00_003859 [Rhizophlyctis rosea]|nr:hypothetical protein HDV00_003859 [Rhizophlyctis rosea]
MNYEDDELELSRYREAEKQFQMSEETRRIKRRKITTSFNEPVIAETSGARTASHGYGWTTASALDGNGMPRVMGHVRRAARSGRPRIQTPSAQPEVDQVIHVAGYMQERDSEV